MRSILSFIIALKLFPHRNVLIIEWAAIRNSIDSFQKLFNGDLNFHILIEMCKTNCKIVYTVPNKFSNTHKSHICVFGKWFSLKPKPHCISDFPLTAPSVRSKFNVMVLYTKLPGYKKGLSPWFNCILCLFCCFND